MAIEFTEQTKENLLALFKTDKGFSSSAFDSRIENYLTDAAERMQQLGITIDFESVSDLELIVFYARYLWTTRNTGERMWAGLKSALNDRLFSEKMRDAHNGT